jgi:hypothetical protein
MQYSGKQMFNTGQRKGTTGWSTKSFNVRMVTAAPILSDLTEIWNGFKHRLKSDTILMMTGIADRVLC